jgi:hypothetical protein
VNCDVYLREQTDLTTTMRDEFQVSAEEQRGLMRRLYLIGRQVEVKTRLLLDLKKISKDRDEGVGTAKVRT